MTRTTSRNTLRPAPDAALPARPTRRPATFRSRRAAREPGLARCLPERSAAPTIAELLPCMRIRRGRRSDRPEILRLVRQSLAGPEGGPESLSPLRRAPREEATAFAPDTGPHHLLVAEIGGSVQGFAATRPCLAQPSEVAELSLLVDPSFRGLHVGSRLYRFLEARLCRGGIRKVVVPVLDGDEPARTFYRQLGFRESGSPRKVVWRSGGVASLVWCEADVPPLRECRAEARRS